MIAFLARDAKTDEEQTREKRRDDPIHVDHDDKYLRLWVIDLNNRKSTLVTRQNIEVVDFDWSPDAASFAIALTSVPGFAKDSNFHLAVLRRSDGQSLRTLSENVSSLNTNIRWSPDSTTLLFFEASPKKGAYWLPRLTRSMDQCGPC